MCTSPFSFVVCLEMHVSSKLTFWVPKFDTYPLGPTKHTWLSKRVLVLRNYVDNALWYKNFKEVLHPNNVGLRLYSFFVPIQLLKRALVYDT